MHESDFRSLLTEFRVLLRGKVESCALQDLERAFQQALRHIHTEELERTQHEILFQQERLKKLQEF